MYIALMLLVGQQEGHPACKKTEWWGAGVVVCLEQGADLHMAQLMPLPLTVSCFNKIQIGFTFLVPAHLGSPGKRAVKRVCVCLCTLFITAIDTLCCYLQPICFKLAALDACDLTVDFELRLCYSQLLAESQCSINVKLTEKLYCSQSVPSQPF